MELTFFFFPTCLLNKTKAPTMDKVHGNINGFSFATSLCLCRGLIIQLIQLATHAKSSTLYGWSYDCTSKFFRLNGLLLFCIIMGLHSVSSAINFRNVVIFYKICSSVYLHLLHPNINIQIIHSVLHTFPKRLTR